MMEKTYVAAADASVLHVDNDIVRIHKLGNRTIFKFDLLDTLQDKGKVLGLHQLPTSISQKTWGPTYLRRSCHG